MSANSSKVLYFTAGSVPTVREIAEIARLETVFRNVQVRSGAVAGDTKFGSGLAETFDYLSGTTIPAAYSGVEGAVTITVPSDVAPDQFKVFPAAVTIDASNVDVQQLAAVKAVIAGGLATMTDLAADASVVWTSSDGTKATVDADGLVTAAAAGEATITATLTAGTAVTAGAIEADTELYTKAAHGFQTGDALKLVSLTGGNGLTAGTTYHFRKVTVDTGMLCASYANAAAKTPVPVNVTVDGTDVVLVKAPQVSTCVVTVAA